MEVAAAIAQAMIKPFTSLMTGPVTPVLMPEHKACKMQYQKDPTLLGQQITQIIVTSPDPETVLPKIAGALGEVFHMDACLIVAGVGQGAAPQTAYWCAADYPTIRQNHCLRLLEDPALAAILTSAEPVAIRDLQASEIWQGVGWPKEALPVRGVLGIQTWFQGRPNGVIVLGRIQPMEWSDWEKELLKAARDEVAIAISQVQLMRQVRTAAQYQTLINQLEPTLRSAKELEQILQVATQEIAQALAVESGLILLLKYSNPLFGKRKAQVAHRRNEELIYPSSTTFNIPKKRLPKAKATVVCEWFRRQSSKIGSQQKSISRVSSDSSISDSGFLLNRSFWLSECSWCQQAFTNAPQPVVIADRREVLSLEEETGIGSFFDKDVMPAILMVPLESQGTVLGFLVLQHHQPRLFSLEELDLVKWVSAQVSTAIIQTQTLRQVQAVVEERTGQLIRSLEVQAKLYEKTRQQVDQLRQLNQLKDEFLSTMSHELKTPLTTMSVAIELLRQPELPHELRAKYLDILKQQCTHEINLINDLLTLQELESHKQGIHLQKIDLKQLILNLAAAFEQQWAHKGLTLVVDLPQQYIAAEDPILPYRAGTSEGYSNSRGIREGKASGRSLMLQTDPDSLNRILLELLTNAGKYSEPDSTVRLSVTQQVNQEVSQIVLTLSNTGPGIDPAELTYIFDKFRRGPGVTQQAVQGTGLGLALVKCLVQHLNGTIDVISCATENTQSCETCFTLTLPQFFDCTKF